MNHKPYSPEELAAIRAWRTYIDTRTGPRPPMPPNMDFDAADSGRWLATVDAIEAKIPK